MMGAQLVSRVFTSWTHLPDRPFRLLAYMALIAKDTNTDPTYWGGRDALAQALGKDPGTASARQIVKCAVAALVAAGAIERSYVGHAGRRSEYRMTLTSGPKRGNESVPQRGNASDPQRGNESVPQRGNESLPKGVTLATPQGTIRNQGGEQEEPNLDSEVSVGVNGRVPKASDSRLALVRARADADAS